MTDEIISLRVLVVSREQELCDLFRQAAALSKVPMEIVGAVDAGSATALLADNTDLTYVDGALPREEIGQIIAALEVAAKPPFSILLVTGHAGVAYPTNGVAGKPSRPEEARWLIERSMRTRLPSRVLVVDDSATMRTIVRKALEATRFPFHISEVAEGFAALKMVREGEFDLIFLDYNMPGFSGLETLSELKREQLRVNVVMITSIQDETLAKRARELGAAFLKKPFFPGDIEKVLCGYYGLRALYPKQA